MRKTVAIQLLPYAQVGTLPARTVYVVPTTYIIDISRACPASEKSNKRDTHGYTAFLYFELCKAARRGRRWSGRPNCNRMQRMETWNKVLQSLSRIKCQVSCTWRHICNWIGVQSHKQFVFRTQESLKKQIRHWHLNMTFTADWCCMSSRGLCGKPLDTDKQTQQTFQIIEAWHQEHQGICSAYSCGTLAQWASGAIGWITSLAWFYSNRGQCPACTADTGVLAVSICVRRQGCNRYMRYM